MTLVCPRCHGGLAREEAGFRCGHCARTYPVTDAIADFAEGEYFDAFASERDVTPALLEGLEDEVAGTRARVEAFFLPRLRARFGVTERLRVLDCGCGNGLSIDLLAAAGVEAWGNDSSLLRRWQWRERIHRDRLCVARGDRLPFPSEAFEVVVSSGVLEHVGVAETAGPPYAVRPLPSRDADRLAWISELLRVVRPGGALWLDFPNGAFPIDFWHGTGAGGARFHSTAEGFLPKVSEVRALVRQIDPGLQARAISPQGRLQFRRVRRRWYGRLFSPAIEAFFRLMRVPGLRGLAASPLNPYLAIVIERTRSASL